MSKTAAQIIAEIAEKTYTLDIAHSRAVRREDDAAKARAARAARALATRAIAAAHESGLASIRWKKGQYPLMCFTGNTPAERQAYETLRRALYDLVGWADVPAYGTRQGMAWPHS